MEIHPFHFGLRTQEFLHMWVIASCGTMPLWTLPAWLLHPRWTLFACCFSKQTVQRASKTNPQPLKPTQKLRSELLAFRCTRMEESWINFTTGCSSYWWKPGTHLNPTGLLKTSPAPYLPLKTRPDKVWTRKNPKRKLHTQHVIGSFSDLPPFVPRVLFACLNHRALIFTLAEILGWHNYCFTSSTSQLSTQRAFLMRSFVCNYFSPGHHIPTSSHHLPKVKGVFETGAFRPLISPKKERERAVSIWLQSQRVKANNSKEVGQSALRENAGV